MMNNKFLSFSISAVLLSALSISGSAPIFAASEGTVEDKTTTLSEQSSESEPVLLAQFGLPNILNRDIPGEIDNRINQIESNIRSRIPNILQPLIPENLFSLEGERILEFANYFDRDVPEFDQQPADISQTLADVAATTGDRYAMIYVSYVKEGGLEFLLFAPNSAPQTLYTEGFGKKQLEDLVTQLRTDLFDSLKRKNTQYLTTSKTLHTALIVPLEGYLKSNDIDGLIFSMDQGLRSLPLAALYDGDSYLIEDYSLTIIPSFVNINSDHLSLRKTPVLAMGAESFLKLEPLPGAALEVKAIADLTGGKGLLNEEFNVKNLTDLRNSQNFPIVHLATHAEFNSGKPKKSSIFLWHDELKLNEIDELSLDSPPVDLFVLSACQTALGSYEAELGFAGLTIASGSKTALGSLWSVSDSGTLVLMQNFYNYLQTEPTKAAALQKAQLDMLRSNLSMQNGQVRDASGAIRNLRLTEDLAGFNLSELAHPFYWSGFTMVGQPW